MHIDAWDEVFIRCRRQSVNALVSHVPSWQGWWPGASVRTDPITGIHEVTLRTHWRLPRTQHLTVIVDRVRPRDKGLEFTVGGDVHGTGEWYHLDRPDGVVVHHLLRGTLQQGNPRRWLAAHRSSVRSALTSLKTRLEAGRMPGAEPDPILQRVQAVELQIYAREVAKHRAQLAAAAAAAAAAEGQA